MQHPDEGTIHAWIDGALPPAEARAIEAHVVECAQCAAAVAEARGLLAASSRILAALDVVPGDVIPRRPAESDLAARAAAPAPVPRSRFRVSGGRWRAAAAVLVLAGGAWLVAEGTRRDVRDERMATVAADASAPQLDTSTPSAPREQSATERVATVTSQSATQSAPQPAPVTQRPAAKAAAKAAAPAARTDNMVAAAGANAPARATVGDAFGTSRAAAAAPSMDSAWQVAPAAPPAAESRVADAAPSREPAAKALLDESIASRRRLALREAPRIVLDRVYVDSVLAADSAAAVAGRSFGSGAGAGVAAYAGAAAPSARAPMAKRAIARPENAITRASGCWIVDTSAWTPAAHRGSDSTALFPRRIELRAERGVLGDEFNELILRPAPGEPPFPAGTAAVWKPIGRDGYRLTIGDAARWIAATITIEGDTLSGRARDYHGERGTIRSSELSGRRAVCRTEP